MTIDKYPVTKDIHYISCNKNPHCHLCVSDTISKLAESIKPTYKWERYKLDKEVRAYEW